MFIILREPVVVVVVVVVIPYSNERLGQEMDIRAIFCASFSICLRNITSTMRNFLFISLIVHPPYPILV